MGIDYLEGRITPEQAELDEVYVNRLVCEMQHGEIAYVDSESWWIDTNRKIWIGGNVAVFTDQEAEAAYNETGGLVRCIRIREGEYDGWIIDASTMNYVPDGSFMERVEPLTTSESEENPCRVIGWIGSEHGLDDLTKMLQRQFAIKLGENAVKALLQHSDED